MGVVQSGSGRADRDAEGVGDLRWREPEVVVEHEDRPLLGRQQAEAAIDLVPIGEAAPPSSGVSF